MVDFLICGKLCITLNEKQYLLLNVKMGVYIRKYRKC